MNRSILSVCLLLITSVAFSQTSASNIRLNTADSADFFLQKGIQEKEKGRRMESLKYFEKAKDYLLRSLHANGNR